jgi:beta-N-acetylhexosaminidase
MGRSLLHVPEPEQGTAETPGPRRPGTLSRRELLGLAVRSVAAVALLQGCMPLRTAEPPEAKATAHSPEESSMPTATEPEPASTPVPTPEPTSSPATADLDAMIGQMLMVGFRGLTLAPGAAIVKDITQRHLGAVVLFEYDMPTQQHVRNIESPAQLHALDAALQAAASVPLLIATDQEGGLVARLDERHGFPPTVSHQYLGASNDLQLTHERAAQMAGTLRDAGINLNLAPVVDLCANPDNPVIARLERCFSADPEVVTAHAQAFIRAHHEQGCLTSLKHFPGHGSSTGDTHLGLVDVTGTWSRDELVPYERLIASGEVDAIMTAHVFNASLDPVYPATLSQATITGLLRGELGYDGVVISDDLQMGAITQEYGFETAVQKAVEAGVDILAFANNSVYEEDVAARAIAVIRGLVQGGTIGEERIAESYRRIRRLKQKLPQ